MITSARTTPMIMSPYGFHLPKLSKGQSYKEVTPAVQNARDRTNSWRTVFHEPRKNKTHKWTPVLRVWSHVRSVPTCCCHINLYTCLPDPSSSGCSRWLFAGASSPAKLLEILLEVVTTHASTLTCSGSSFLEEGVFRSMDNHTSNNQHISLRVAATPAQAALASASTWRW